jgi:hypothetical protein
LSEKIGGDYNGQVGIFQGAALYEQAAARPPLKAAAKVQTHRQTAPPVIIK